MTSQNETDRKILIVTCQPLPQAGQPATGGAIRAHALGEALKERGHTVLYSIPEQCCTNNKDNGPIPRDLAHNVKDLDQIIEKAGPDIVLFCNWGLAGEALECGLPVVIDMNGSLVLENYYRQRGKILEDSLAKIEAVSKADFLMAGSENQKSYLTSWCLLAGFKPEDIAIGIVPFSLSPDIPQAESTGQIEFILAGHDWPWLNGRDYIHTVCDELDKAQQGILHVYSSRPPYVDVFNEENSATDAKGLLQNQKMARLLNHGPVDFDTLTAELGKASVALDLWQRNPERELAIPSRVVAYLWAGLPVITSDYGEMAKLIKQYDAGWIIEENNHQQLREVIGKILRMAPSELAIYKENAGRLFADHFAWNKTIGPLDQFCRLPKHNRAPSSLTAKFYYYQRLALELQNQLENREQNHHVTTGGSAQPPTKYANSKSDAELMGRVHRRPRGLELAIKPARILRGLKRTFIGIPVLSYLTVLILTGHFLHILRIRLGR
ncbi:MAG: glycosyltransferase family 4 protein [Proteobacteria bacterium]|nr:glycosyltransferase family 4 protein [Pseudomonadota bacterium]MBU1715666.1 glycosyltransferase family 4 protein [Pseudomonadota bacterium]